MRVPKRKSEELVKRQSGPILITAKGLKKLEDDVADLQKLVPQMIKEVEHTKSHGDFSENAAYQDAKATLRRTYNRIASMQARIKSAVLIEKQSGNTIQIGSKVSVEAGGKTLDFEILGSHESNPGRGIISNTSPLGSALIGHKAGDEVFVQALGTKTKYCILKIY